MNQPPEKQEWVELLSLAADSIVQAVAGCADRIHSFAPGPHKPGEPLLPRRSAIDHFGPLILARWSEWLAARSPEQRQAAVKALIELQPAVAKQFAGGELDKHTLPVSDDDKRVAVEYLTAIPATARDAMLSASESPTTNAEVLDRQDLIRFLPINVPPFSVGSEVPGTPYRLDALLGAGGFGAVYRAMNRLEQNTPPRALKFCLNPELLPSLRRERDLLDRLMSAGAESRWSDRIVKLYGHDLAAPVPFLVYEYIPGGNLFTRLAMIRQRTGQRLPTGKIRGLIRRICEPIAFAHDLGLVHRDIKPSNILVDGETLKLGDFGIGGVVAEHAAMAEKLRESGRLSLSEQCSFFRGAGTPLYMSPEQRKGEAPDPRHDVYSIGVMWYQLLVGDFHRELHQGWADELADEYQVASKYIDLIQACVGYVKKRPASARELLGMMQPPGNTPPPPPRKVGDSQVLGKHEGLITCLAYGRDSRNLLASSSDGVVRSWDTDTGIISVHYKLRGLSVLALASSPDHRRALFGCQDDTARVWELGRSKALHDLIGHTKRVTCVAISPDGKHAATGSADTTIRLWHLGSGKELLCIREHSGTLVAVEFSAGNRFVASCSEDGVIGLWDVETGAEYRPRLTQADWLHCLAVSPDDRHLVCGGKSSLVLWDVENGTRVREFVGHATPVSSVAFTRGGRYLVSASADEPVRLWEVATGKLVHQFEAQAAGATVLAVSPDGKQLATGGQDRVIKLWLLPRDS